MVYVRPIYPNELFHHGIKGQKWGIRRYQNPDGSLTAAGKRHYLGHGTWRDTKAKHKVENDAAKMARKEGFKANAGGWTIPAGKNGSGSISIRNSNIGARAKDRDQQKKDMKYAMETAKTYQKNYDAYKKKFQRAAVDDSYSKWQKYYAYGFKTGKAHKVPLSIGDYEKNLKLTNIFIDADRRRSGTAIIDTNDLWGKNSVLMVKFDPATGEVIRTERA